MKTTIKLLAVIALVLVAFGQHSTASAGGGAGGIDYFKSKGANALFSSTDPSGCIVTDVFVFAGEEVFQSPPGPRSAAPRASLFISQYDFCTGTQLLAADGFALLADSDLQVSSKLESATLNATVNVFDFVSGTSFDVFVDLTWTGIGPLSRQNSHSHFHSPGCTFNNHSNGTFRSAEASGSVSDGATNFTPEPSLGIDIFSVKGGSVTIGCGF
jgi:hypothetical protein